MKYKEIIVGLVIELPEQPGHVGVIVNSTKVNKDWYKVVVVCDDADILVCNLKIKDDGEYLDYKHCTSWDVAGLVSDINSKDYNV